MHLKLLKKIGVKIKIPKQEIPKTEKPVAKLTEKQILEILPESELRDREQIIKELIGNQSDEYIHDFEVATPEGGKQRVITISYDGIREAAKKIFDEWNVIETWVDKEPDRYDARARVTVKLKWKTIDGNIRSKKWTTIGSATEMKSKPDDRVQQFDYRIAISKAIRNATRHLIPKELLDTMIDEYKKKEANGDGNADSVANNSKEETQ